AGGVAVGTRVVTDNPVTPAAGTLPAVTLGELNGATIRAGSIGTLKVTGKAAAGLLGSVAGSTIAVNSTAATAAGPQAIRSLTVVGDALDLVLDAPAAVGSIAVGGRVTTLSSGTRIQAAYNTGAKLGTLTAGAWGQSGISLTTDLVTQAVGT